jgi:hypothetical protein
MIPTLRPLKALIAAASAVLFAVIGLSPLAVNPTSAAGTGNWTTYGHDVQRSGYDPDNTNAFCATAGCVPQAWSQAVDGVVYGQPLVWNNRVYVATDKNKVYAFDAVSGALAWGPVSVGASPAATDVTICAPAPPILGVLSTPVIDPATGNLYVVAPNISPNLHYAMYSLNANTGAMLGTPVTIDPWPGTAAEKAVQAKTERQRGALLLANGFVYVTFSSVGDCGTYAGWVAAVTVSASGAQAAGERTWRATTSTNGGGIWATPSLDTTGNVWVATSNSFATNGTPYQGPAYDGSDSVNKLSSTLQLQGFFAPTNWADINVHDVDIGSFTPVQLGNGFIYQAGKNGHHFLLRSSDFIHPDRSTASNSAPLVFGGDTLCAEGVFGAAAWDAQFSNLYVPCAGLTQVRVSTNPPGLQKMWTGPGTQAAGNPGSTSATPIIAYQAVWYVNVNTNTLYALNSAGAVLAQIDLPTQAAHFASPVSGLGRIFVGTSQRLTAYLPTNSTPATAPITMLTTPARVGDTRSAGGPVMPGSDRCFTIGGQGGVPTTASGVVVNLTTVSPAATGWLTLYPAGQALPATSTLNFDATEYAIANGAYVRLGTGGQVCVHAGQSAAHAVLDVTGYIPTGGATLMPLLPTPVRLIDTRSTGGPIAANASRCFTIAGQGGIPANASGVLLNVTAVGYTASGSLTLFPGGQTLPATSTLNFDARHFAFANNALAKLGNGQVCVATAQAATQVALDAIGYLTTDGATRLPLLSQPQRLVDTRAGGRPVTPGADRCFTVAGVNGIPATATGVVLNLTATGQSGIGWMTVYAAGQALPATSTLNFVPTETAIANGLVARIGTNRQVCVNAGQAGAQVILDATGYLP